MSPAERRRLIIQVLELIARLEEESPDAPVGARRAAVLLARGSDAEALEALRQASSNAIAATGWLIESHLPAAGAPRTESSR